MAGHDSDNVVSDNDVAVIGMAGRFPGAASVEEMLRSFVKAVRAHQLYLPNTPMHQRAIETLRADGSPTYRVISGRYASKGEATPHVRAIRAKHGLRAAWVAPLSQAP